MKRMAGREMSQHKCSEEGSRSRLECFDAETRVRLGG